MKRLALVLVLSAPSGGCANPDEYRYLCGLPFARPTTEELTVGMDARVRQVSEGPKNGIGGGSSQVID